jgi:Toprim domain
MFSPASQLSQRLSANALAVCRAYLPKGRRSGAYWTCGDVHGTKGRSLFVKLWGERAGKFCDAATGQHGDLLDLIGLNRGFARLRDTLAEARAFLREPLPAPSSFAGPQIQASTHDRQKAAAKLFALGKPLPGTLAEAYLRGRGIALGLDLPALRFHPACYCRPNDTGPLKRYPALLAAITDVEGALTGLQRTFLAPDGRGKAPFDAPRRDMGLVLGHAVRFGQPDGVLAAGEGLETVLSLLTLFPTFPMAAGLGAARLAAMRFPPRLCRLYHVRDNDRAGGIAEEKLRHRCRALGIGFFTLAPALIDLNADLRELGPWATRERMLAQLTPQDRLRFGWG